MRRLSIVCVLTEEEMETAHQNGIDIICIVGGSRDVHLKDAFLLVGRVPILQAAWKTEVRPQCTFPRIEKKLPRKGMNRDGLGV
jgi:hypothetical protein